MKTLLIALVLVLSASAQDYLARYNTQGRVNCRWFTELADTNERTSYIEGMVDGLEQAYEMLDEKSGKVLTIFNIQLTFEEMAKGVEEVCNAPANARIRAMDAYAIFVTRIKGANDAAISSLEVEARRYAEYW